MKNLLLLLLPLLITGNLFAQGNILAQENIFPLSKYEIPSSSPAEYYRDSIHSKTLNLEILSPVIVSFKEMTLATGLEIDVILDTIEYDESTLDPTVYDKDTAKFFAGQSNTPLTLNSFSEFVVGDTIRNIHNFDYNSFISNMPLKVVFHVIVHGIPTQLDEIYDCSLSEFFTLGGEPTYNLGRSQIIVPANLLIEICRVDLVSGLFRTNNIITLSISPNPASGVIFLNTEEDIEQVEVLTLDGQLKLKEEGTSQLDLSNLTSGIYIIKVQTNRGIASQKIILE